MYIPLIWKIRQTGRTGNQRDNDVIKRENVVFFHFVYYLLFIICCYYYAAWLCLLSPLLLDKISDRLHCPFRPYSNGSVFMEYKYMGKKSRNNGDIAT